MDEVTTTIEEEVAAVAKSVEVRRLSKKFGGVQAVDGIDLKSTEGEFLVLLGPSGCGKTTLLRMIAGLEHPTEGEILIGDDVVNGLPPRIRQIAMVFQSYALYPHMTVARNIGFPLKAEGLDAATSRKRIEWASSLLDIQDLLERRPRQLSGGERQRVALARALVREPAVFLLDEPLSNLDAKLRAAARDDLLEFQRRVGTTTIYVTHDQVEAMGMGDRIAVMNKGKIRQLGTPDEVYNRPADTFVATFIGSPPMNMLERGNFLMGFRPEQLLPVGIVDGDVMPMTYHVNRIENLGSERYLYGFIRGYAEDIKIIAMLPSTVTVAIAAGQDHEFAVANAKLRYFDKETGLAMVGAPT
ncbi:MAG: ABC transporter ATP-binding protein [Acidimicrobiia bacterium]|nr:ABC transporter ATP-binding protein [Acidimicrobiia bacterium]MDH3470896.1 ABC transporter ATP-binding protein [Acidimicrobiia bacterium]